MKQKDMTCSYCGKLGCVSLGLCHKCYQRQWKSGTLEYKERKRGPDPNRWCDRTKKIIALYKDGMKQSDIARSLGVSRQLVNQVVYTRVPKSNYHKLTHMSLEEMAEWFVANGHGGTKDIWIEWLKETANGETR